MNQNKLEEWKKALKAGDEIYTLNVNTLKVVKRKLIALKLTYCTKLTVVDFKKLGVENGIFWWEQVVFPTEKLAVAFLKRYIRGYQVDLKGELRDLEREARQIEASRKVQVKTIDKFSKALESLS